MDGQRRSGGATAEPVAVRLPRPRSAAPAAPCISVLLRRARAAFRRMQRCARRARGMQPRHPGRCRAGPPPLVAVDAPAPRESSARGAPEQTGARPARPPPGRLSRRRFQTRRCWKLPSSAWCRMPSPRRLQRAQQRRLCRFCRLQRSRGAGADTSSRRAARASGARRVGGGARARRRPGRGVRRRRGTRGGLPRPAAGALAHESRRPQSL